MVPALPSLSLSLSLSLSSHFFVCGCASFVFAVGLCSYLRLSYVGFAGCPFFDVAEVLCSTLRLSPVGFRGCPLFVFALVLCWFSRLSSAFTCLSPHCLPCASPGPSSTYVEPSCVKPGLGPLLVPPGLHQVDSSPPWHLQTPLGGHCGFMMGVPPPQQVCCECDRPISFTTPSLYLLHSHRPPASSSVFPSLLCGSFRIPWHSFRLPLKPPWLLVDPCCRPHGSWPLDSFCSLCAILVGPFCAPPLSSWLFLELLGPLRRCHQPASRKARLPSVHLTHSSRVMPWSLRLVQH